MSDHLFDRAVRDWLEDGSDRTPPTAIDAVLLAVKTTTQERDLRIPRRFTLMPTYMRLAAGIAIVALLGAGAYALLGRGPNVGPPGSTASPTPVPTQTAVATSTPTLDPTDTSAWTTFESDRYGFTIKHPDDWTEDRSDHDWTFENDLEAWTSTGPDSFFNQGARQDMGVRVSVWSVQVAPGTTAVSWLQTWCDATSPTGCAGLPAVVVSAETGDGHAGVLSQFGDTMAAFVDGTTVYVVALWRSENDPSVLPYGGARRLIEAYISTLILPAASPTGSPSPT